MPTDIELPTALTPSKTCWRQLEKMFQGNLDIMCEILFNRRYQYVKHVSGGALKVQCHVAPRRQGQKLALLVIKQEGRWVAIGLDAAETTDEELNLRKARHDAHLAILAAQVATKAQAKAAHIAKVALDQAHAARRREERAARAAADQWTTAQRLAYHKALDDGATKEEAVAEAAKLKPIPAKGTV